MIYKRLRKHQLRFTYTSVFTFALVPESEKEVIEATPSTFLTECADFKQIISL